MGKKTTTIQRQQAGTGNSSEKMLSSILHSLRHSSVHIKIDKLGRKIRMWDETKGHLNFILINGDKKNLADLTDDDKYKIAQDMLQPALDDLNGKNINLDLEAEIKDLALVVRNKHKNLIRHKNTPQSRIAKLKDQKIDKATLNAFISEINESSVKSKPSKILGIQSFAEENNRLIELKNEQKDFRINSSTGLQQESFLKFPKLPNGTISPDRHTEILEKYYKEHWPEYEVQASFWHGDEQSLNDNMEDCGGHPHCRVSCKNSVTGKYDLIRKQKEKAVEYIKDNPESFPGIEPSKLKASYNTHKRRDVHGNKILLMPEQKLEDAEARIYVSALGVAHQAMIFEYGQKELEKDGIELHRNVNPTDLEKERLLQLEKDSKLPKHERIGNGHNLELIKEEKILEHLKLQNIRLKQDNLKYSIIINQKGKELIDIDKSIESKYKLSVQKFEKVAHLYINSNKEELKEMVDFVSSHDNKKHLENKTKQENLWLPVINKIERSITDESSTLRKIHKAALFIPGYEKLFEEIKPIYFQQYKEIVGDKHQLDNNENKNRDHVLDQKLDGINEEFNIFDFFQNSDDEMADAKDDTLTAKKFLKMRKDQEGEKKKKSAKNKMG